MEDRECPMLIDERHCNKCKEIKQISKFYHGKTICKPCANIEMTGFRKALLEKKRAIQAEKLRRDWEDMKNVLKDSLLHKSWKVI